VILVEIFVPGVIGKFIILVRQVVIILVEEIKTGRSPLGN
jgi:hypothetical protein